MRADAFVLSAESTYFFCYELNLRFISLSSSIVCFSTPKNIKNYIEQL